MAASAAYHLGSQATKFVATPSAELGSIGVYGLHVDASRAVDAAGLTPTYIASGISPFKTEGNPFEPLGEEARAFLQGQVDEIGRRFVRAVARGRRVSESTVTTLFGGGRVLLAPAAHRVGMVDGIETLATALSLAPGAKRGGVAGLVPPPRAVSFLEMSASQRQRHLEDLRHGACGRSSPRQNLIRVLAREGKVYADKAADARNEEYWRRRIEEEKRG